MLQIPSKMLVTPDNVDELREQFRVLFSLQEKDAREAAFVTEGPLVRGKMDAYALRPGLRMFTVDMEVEPDSQLDLEPACPGVVLVLLLDGRSEIAVERPGSREVVWECLPGRNIVGTFRPGRVLWKVHGATSHRAVELQMDSDMVFQLISEYCEVVPGSPHLALARPDDFSRPIYQPLTPELALIAHQTLSCPLDAPARKLFMESKALEILALQLGMLSSSDIRDAAAPNRAERERLEEARRILDEEYADPPSLLVLARRVGLNDFKLKRGFKALFDNTVFGYVRKVRMENALAMLQTDTPNVGEVAAAMGYTNFGHFSVAFRRQFGIAPSDVKRARIAK